MLFSLVLQACVLTGYRSLYYFICTFEAFTRTSAVIVPYEFLSNYLIRHLFSEITALSDIDSNNKVCTQERQIILFSPAVLDLQVDYVAIMNILFSAIKMVCFNVWVRYSLFTN
jgi:hypothetical protein